MKTITTTLLLNVAFSLTLTTSPAEAITKNQVRKIARQEVQRAITAPGPSGLPLQGPQGPPGPQGPAGPASTAVIGTAARFVHLRTTEGSTDIVVESLSQGVEEENVRVHFDGGPDFPGMTFYCIHDLPDPVHGAQVTALGHSEIMGFQELRDTGVFIDDLAFSDPLLPGQQPIVECQIVAGVKNGPPSPAGQSGAIYIWIY